MIAQVVPITRLRRDTATWSYLVPPRVRLAPGALVSVPLQGRECLGIVWQVEEQDGKATRPISRVICARPLLRTAHRQFVEQLSLQGLCSLSTALFVWLPRALRASPLSSRTSRLLAEYASEPEPDSVPPQHCILIPGRRPEQERLTEAKFGSRFASLFADSSETDELASWLAVSRGHCSVGIGREHALFAPWRNLSRITVIEPEDVFYYHEQIPYLNLIGMAERLAGFMSAETSFRSYLPTLAAGELWPGAAGQDSAPPLQIVDLHREPLLNPALVEAIRQTERRGETALLLYNARDRSRIQVKDGLQSLVKLPGIETLAKQLARLLGYAELPKSIALGTRSLFHTPHERVGLVSALSLDPLLENPLFADQVHGWGDIGRLLSYGAPCIIQAYEQEHPLIQALRSRCLPQYLHQEILARKAHGLPPFGQHIALSAPESKIDPEDIAQLRERLLPFVSPPWQLSHPLRSTWHKLAYLTLLISCQPSTERLPTGLRRALVSLPRPWKVQSNPWNLL